MQPLPDGLLLLRAAFELAQLALVGACEGPASRLLLCTIDPRLNPLLRTPLDIRTARCPGRWCGALRGGRRRGPRRCCNARRRWTRRRRKARRGLRSLHLRLEARPVVQCAAAAQDEKSAAVARRAWRPAVAPGASLRAAAWPDEVAARQGPGAQPARQALRRLRRPCLAQFPRLCKGDPVEGSRHHEERDDCRCASRERCSTNTQHGLSSRRPALRSYKSQTAAGRLVLNPRSRGMKTTNEMASFPMADACFDEEVKCVGAASKQCGRQSNLDERIVSYASSNSGDRR